jgi:hypothetical protein
MPHLQLSTNKQKWKFLSELLSYTIFVSVLYVVSYSNHNSDAQRQVQHLRQLLLNSRNFTNNFTEVGRVFIFEEREREILLIQIIKINDYWKWLDESFVDNIFVGNWYNGEPNNDSQGYLRDQTSLLIGWATMRQLRVRSG